jgi:hypothetical protein
MNNSLRNTLMIEAMNLQTGLDDEDGDKVRSTCLLPRLLIL